MKFHKGDHVMHWKHGLGQVIDLEERDLDGARALYYMVQFRDMTVWVPADSNLQQRLRPPIQKQEFEQMLAILSSPGEPLPDERSERKTRLRTFLGDGSPQSLCRIISGLHAYRKAHRLNESDQSILLQARNALLEEWEYVLAIPHGQAAHELHRRLASTSLPLVQ